MSLLKKAITLKLNAAWQVIGYCTVEDAIIALNGKPGGTQPAVALDIELDEGGRVVRSIPTKWEDWINLPVKENEPCIMGVRGPIRAPLVIIDANFDKMPMKTPKLSKEAILERDGYKDQYTGEQLTHEDATLDHVIPKDVWRRRGFAGSPNQWTNLVACKDKRNFAKGNKTPRQAGIKLIRKPKAPKQVPVSTLHKPKLDVHRPFFPERN